MLICYFFMVDFLHIFLHHVLPLYIFILQDLHRALVTPRQARRQALVARSRLQPHWGLLAELSQLDHISSHTGDSSLSSRHSTTSSSTLGTPRRALIAPCQARRQALAARPRLRSRWGLLIELLSQLLISVLSLYFILFRPGC
jgi:hypothetical protein